jgi:hypothetical protein
MTEAEADESRLNDTVSYMNYVNQLMAWCERVPPALNTPAHAEWASERDTLLRIIGHYREELAKACAEEDAGIHKNIWYRLAHGDFEVRPDDDAGDGWTSVTAKT